MDSERAERITNVVLLAIIALALFWLLRWAGELANGWYMLAALAVALIATWIGGMLHGMNVAGAFLRRKQGAEREEREQ
ncbi:MAG: hypothetical protein KC445_07055 [Anaerolineales bacterium]|nr:hypothetical protein [Anaerolineales bacterium]